MVMPKLRFAPIIRVSTERQADKGESLHTQKAQIVDTVEALGGTIPESCWSYSGQEHASVDQERKKLDKLLQDSGKDIFDCVIVCDASRWSRDNKKSKDGLEILRQNEIKFFVGGTEYNLFEPAAMFFLGMSTEVNEFQALEQARKSILNRISRAKRGIPSTGKLPFGRTWSEKEGWDTDPDKKNIIIQAATRYLAGESIVDIGQSYGINPSGLYRTMTQKSGDKWEIHFRKESLRIDETIIMDIPRLLPEETIQAIQARGAANKTYSHGELKNRYLLSRMLFCQKCGRTLFGYTNHRGARYYAHSRSKALKPCTEHKHPPAKLIEPAVMLLLARNFGDVDLIKKAISDAVPDQEKAKNLKEERTTLERRIKDLAQEQDRLVLAVSKGALDFDDVRDRRDKIKDSEARTKDRIDAIENELSYIPGADKIEKLNMFKGKLGRNLSQDYIKWILKKSYDYQKDLLRSAFAGKDSKGARYGVYVLYNQSTKQWDLELRGILGTELMSTPMDTWTIAELFKLDPDYQDVEAEAEKIRESITKSTMH